MKNIKNDFSLMAILFVTVAVAINIVGFQLIQVLRLPIFIDAIGTILVGVLAGPWVGAIVGLLTNTITGIFNPVYFAYSFTSMMIGFTAGVLSSKGMFKTWSKTILSGLIITIMSTFVSGIVTAFVFRGATGGTGSIFTSILVASGQNILTAVFSVTFLQEIVDKTLSVLIVRFIISQLSMRYLSKMKYGMNFINMNKKKS